MVKTIIIGDVHGRTFWRESVHAVLKDNGARIVFLGDYLDCYPFEWGKGVKYERDAIERFKEIIQLKKDYPDRITLLIGNHDCTYAIGKHICDCRTDKHNYAEIKALFEDNRQCFQLAAEEEINGVKFVYSHAGILRGWVERHFGSVAEERGFDVVKELNAAWQDKNERILDALGEYDIYRGYCGVENASPVWADIRSWSMKRKEDTYGFNVVGHTMCKSPIKFETIIDIDCQKVFSIDDEGKLKEFSHLN